MKFSFTLLIFTILTSSTFAQKHTDNFVGKWKTADNHTITIIKTKVGYIGTTGPGKIIVLYDVKFEEDKWIGYVTNPIKKESGPCELTLEKDRIKVTAYKGLLYKTFYWTKVK